ncbi:hypothetical protein LTR37_008024 [Vermiconidia calcicola]|uniref:Uncharacterized protein n=1 Tax=Vermiconidia calcicola TaxID=1690605 RepID=A0ACC3NC63_9PEZI|nr:hypothetical protein LTR37_008024 [Vermiconidia calcicola]
MNDMNDSSEANGKIGVVDTDSMRSLNGATNTGNGTPLGSAVAQCDTDSAHSLSGATDTRNEILPDPAVADCHLFSLPAELRNIIYTEALVQTRSTYLTAAGVPEPPLLLTCKLLQEETLPIYYQNTFRVPSTNWDSSVIIKWQVKCLELLDDYGLRVDTRSVPGQKTPHWENLLLWLKGIYEGSIDMHRQRPSQMYGERKSIDRVVIGGMFYMVAKMRKKFSWEEVMEVLDEQHMVLVRVDARWA